MSFLCQNYANFLKNPHVYFCIRLDLALAFLLWRALQSKKDQGNIPPLEAVRPGALSGSWGKGQRHQLQVKGISFFFMWEWEIFPSLNSSEIKRCLLLGRKAMTNLDSIFKSRDITLPIKVCVVKAMVFPVVMYGCESWTIKKAEHWRIDVFEQWCWRRLMRVPWTARRSNQSILKEINPGYWKDWCWSWCSSPLVPWREELMHWKRRWCWEILRAGRE